MSIKSRIYKHVYFWLIVLILLVTSLFLLLENNKSKGIYNKKLESFCGIKYVPQNFVIIRNKFSIESDINTTDWVKYNGRDFTVIYPEKRKIYGQEEGFSLCPTTHCQDREMFIKKQDVNNKCNNIRFLIDRNRQSSDEYLVILWENLSVGEKDGIGLSVIPFSSGGLRGSSTGVFEKDNQNFEFSIGSDDIHYKILQSLQPI